VALGEPDPDAIAIEAAVKGLSAWRSHGFGPDDAAGLKYGIQHMDVDHLQAGGAHRPQARRAHRTPSAGRDHLAEASAVWAEAAARAA